MRTTWTSFGRQWEAEIAQTEAGEGGAGAGDPRERIAQGLSMRDSQVVAEWITEGKIEGKVGAILRLLEKRFPPGAPAQVATVIKASTDVEQLNRWFDAAIDAASLEQFQQAMGG